MKGIVTESGGSRLAFPGSTEEDKVSEEGLPLNIEEHILDRLVSWLGVWTEPPLVSDCPPILVAFLEIPNTGAGTLGIFLGGSKDRFDILHLPGRASLVSREMPPPVVDIPGGGERTRELNVDNPLNGSMQVLRGVIGIDVGEVVCQFDRVVSAARLNEAVRSEDWKPLYEVISGQTKVITSYSREWRSWDRQERDRWKGRDHRGWRR